MSENSTPLAVAITPMRRTADGIWETTERDTAQFFLVELVQDGGEEAEVVVECQDARSAALAARVVAATVAALGLAHGGEAGDTVSAFDEETASLLAAYPTPEVTAAGGAWVEEDEVDAPETPLQ